MNLEKVKFKILEEFKDSITKGYSNSCDEIDEYDTIKVFLEGGSSFLNLNNFYLKLKRLQSGDPSREISIAITDTNIVHSDLVIDFPELNIKEVVLWGSNIRNVFINVKGTVEIINSITDKIEVSCDTFKSLHHKNNESLINSSIKECVSSKKIYSFDEAFIDRFLNEYFEKNYFKDDLMNLILYDKEFRKSIKKILEGLTY